MTLFGDIYRNRSVLITGHTGFKGSWLTLWLTELGARISGVALAPESSPNHWHLLDLPLPTERIQDIRDFASLLRLVQGVQPEILFHLAAQPLVRRSYREPLETWATNVMGTANLLEACRQTSSVRALVIVTTDKCYENREWPWGYREIDPLGGRDPYSASKAAAELVIASYRNAFFGPGEAPLVASVRAGNVIGGGDWSEDRLIPDLVRALVADKSLEVRSPEATRPWQHVLDPLAGYLLLGQRLLEGHRDLAEPWNFGPANEDHCCVRKVLEMLQSQWPQVTWHQAGGEQPHEAALLHLDSTKARRRLGWRPVWDLAAALDATAQWYRTFLEQGRVLSRPQLDRYIEAARAAHATWCTP